MVTSGGPERPRTWLVDAPEGASGEELRERLGATGSGPVDPPRHGYAVTARSAVRRASSSRILVVAGPDAGLFLPLEPGRWASVGRDPLCDLTIDDPRLSRRHLRVRHGRAGFEVEDLGSTNGVRTQGGSAAEVADAAAGPVWPAGSVLLAGGSALSLEVDDHAPMPGTVCGGRLLVKPWPRARPGLADAELRTPAEPSRRSVRPPSVWTWGLPLLASLVAAAVLRMPLVLVLGLLGPAMVLGQHLGDRKSAAREHAEELDTWRNAVDDIRVRAASCVDHERAVRWQLTPGVAGAVRALCPAPSTVLWGRRGEDPLVVLGVGAGPTGVVVDGRPLESDGLPVVLALDGPVAVVGAPHLRDAAARSWLLQLVTGHPPDELAVVVSPDELSDQASWDLLAWIPHTRPRVADGLPLQLRWGEDLVLVDDVRDAPQGVTRVVLHAHDLATLERPGRPSARFIPTLLGLAPARALARRMAGLTTGTSGSGGASEPPRLGDLLPWPVSPEQARRGWADGPSMGVALGLDAEGAPVVVDLTKQGPHALVAGTTGSGKSELLRSLVVGLALLNPPSALSVLLVDYKGGSSLAGCAGLPHAVGLVTDLDPHLGERVLLSLRAELTRRERRLAEAGVRDVRDYRGGDLPRLVVVVDEFRVLAEELPDFMAGMVRLAAVGRSLGLHLVLATQRPAGVVGADLRANVNLRIALRVRDVADSLDVLECPDAARLPEGEPGRALLRTGSTTPQPLHVAPVGRPRRRVSNEWSVREVTDAWHGWAELHTEATEEDTAADLEDLVEVLVAAAGDVRPPPVWLAPLPDVVGDAELEGVEPLEGMPPHARPWALVDLPGQQRRAALGWALRGHVGVVGSARTGRTTALVALARSAPGAWLYVLDVGRGLEGTGLGEDPRVRAWVGPEDRAHGLRVLEVLLALAEERVRSGAHLPPVVVLVDGWDRWVEAYAELEAGRGVDLLLRLLREGPAAGVFVAVSGDRALLGGKIAPHLPEVWALRLHDPGDLAMAGLRASQLPRHQPPGRMVRTSDGTVAQVLLSDGRPEEANGTPAPTSGPAGQPPGAPGQCAPPPRVVRLPLRAHGQSWAVGGDEASPVPEPIGAFLVVGPPRSGVSSTLLRLAGAPGPTTVHVAPGSWEDGELARHLQQPGTTTVMVDEAHLLVGTPTEDLVLDWATRTSGRLLVGADADACAGLYRGLVPHVARARRGLLLQPQNAQHGAVLGVRAPLGHPAVPGRGVLVDRGRCTRVQVLLG
ncbi:FtsK/SpoIIIE domain-containing protein [Ornithinimicrobium tianjinense]|nr:FtsK/SpoIIIE domain-containing protein [Ornithinimicrobium tianjinense]